MDKQKLKDLIRAINMIDKIYPADDFILNYSDFLKHRDYLLSYQYNPNVLNKLIEITLENWNTKKRISRISLILRINQYYNFAHKNIYKSYFTKHISSYLKVSKETKTLLFNLFKKTIEEEEYISKNQIEVARRSCCSNLINLELTDTEVEWYCANAFNNSIILNRVLRYPAKSNIINNWVNSNFYNNQLRNRRSEAISWKLDQNPNFEIDEQTLIDDFNYINKCDKEAIKAYKEELNLIEILKNEVGDFLPKKQQYDYQSDSYNEYFDLTHPTLNLTRRAYKVPHIESLDLMYSIPDFQELEDTFYNNLSNYKKTTMIWAIAYSRIDNKQKTNLLKKYYCNDTYQSIFNVCNKTKNSEMLRWILEQQ